ncbi:MAG: GrdX family protein [Bacillota bacterium]
MEKFIVVTNNPKVKKEFKDLDVKFLKKDLLEVLTYVRDKIHNKHKILSHPLAGSVKPNETPFKSILISKQPMDKLDMDSLKIIEGSIQVAKKLFRDKSTRKWPERILKDFSVIDLDLISSAIDSAM